MPSRIGAAKSRRRGLAHAGAALAVLSGVLLSSCGDESAVEDVSPTPSETTTLGQTAVPGLNEVVGPVVVYAVVVNGRRDVGLADHEVRTVDVASGQVIARFLITDAWWIPGVTQLQGSRLYVTHLDRIAWSQQMGARRGSL